MLRVEQPILTGSDMRKIRALDMPGFHVETVSILHYKGTKLKQALSNLCAEVDYCDKKGANLLILSDVGVDETMWPSPHSLRSPPCSSIWCAPEREQYLIMESGEPREVHHFATLMGYGAAAIYPYLAHETIRQLVEEDVLKKDFYTAVEDYDEAILEGITKIASKMGISTLQSYRGCQGLRGGGNRPGSGG